MRVSKPVAVLIAAFTAWPISYIFVFFAFMFRSFDRLKTSAPNSGFEAFEALMMAHFATMLLTMTLLVFYIVHLFKNPVLAGDKRVLWAVTLFMGNVIAMPVYWFLYVWRSPALIGGSTTAGLPPAGAV